MLLNHSAASSFSSGFSLNVRNLFIVYCSTYLQLHTCFLLLAGTRATILRVSLVELPCEIEGEGASGRVVGGNLADAIDDGTVLVGIEYIVATQVGCQGAEAAQVEVALHSEVASEDGAVEACVVYVAFRRQAHTCAQAPAMRQLHGVVPSKVDIRAAEGDLAAVGTWRRIVLELCIDEPCGMP